MISMPAFRRPRASTRIPRSWGSNPTLPISTRILASGSISPALLRHVREEPRSRDPRVRIEGQAVGHADRAHGLAQRRVDLGGLDRRPDDVPLRADGVREVPEAPLHGALVARPAQRLDALDRPEPLLVRRDLVGAVHDGPADRPVRPLERARADDQPLARADLALDLGRRTIELLAQPSRLQTLPHAAES